MTAHIAIANDVSTLMQRIDGYKTYLGLIVAALAILLDHAGVQMPGVNVAGETPWLSQLWGLYMAFCTRSAMNKINTGAKQ